MKQAFSTLFVAVLVVWTGIAKAQTTWVQIEAHNSLNNAQESMFDYVDRLKDINGFRMGSGWYAIALGPYDEEGAIARLQFLRAQQAVPPDSFLVDSSVYTQQFWPIGANALNGPPIEQPIVTLGEQTAALVQTQPVAQLPVFIPEPPEETRRQALQSEARLSREEKADIQIAMQWFGFYNGRIDAAFGPGTRNSMSSWQQSKGYEATGVLTTRQRAELTDSYRDVLASLGLGLVRDEVAGIEVEMPRAMVAFERYEPPFAHYNAINDSGVTVLVISQTGDQATLLGLYDIMQTLEIVPLDGERQQSGDSFTLTGTNASITSYTYAVLDGGAVKGFTLIWPTNDDQRREVALRTMRDSFTSITGTVLPNAYGDGNLEQSIDLISGLQIRRPQLSRSGFYIDARGNVLTTSEAVAGCSRITLDEDFEAEVVAEDAELGLALLRPTALLSPMNFARFMAAIPRLQSEVAVSGYSFEGMLSSPTLTFGTLADSKGLRGENTMKRLALAATDSDAGGPVFDTSGSVLGMLLPNEDIDGKRLPDNVSFATDASTIAEFLSNNGFTPAASDGGSTLSPEDLTRLGSDVTVLVSCWE